VCSRSDCNQGCQLITNMHGRSGLHSGSWLHWGCIEPPHQQAGASADVGITCQEMQGFDGLCARHAGAAMSDDDSDEYEEAHVFDYTPPKQGTGHDMQARAAYKPLAARALPL